MDILLVPNLKFNWTPGVAFHAEKPKGFQYEYFSMERQGPSNSGNDISLQPWIAPPIPDVLAVYITVKENISENQDLLQKVYDVLSPEHEVDKQFEYIEVPDPRNIEIEKKNSIIYYEFNKSFEAFTNHMLKEHSIELKCSYLDCGDLYFNVYPAIEFKKRIGNLRVGMHKDTPLYKFLAEHGILEKAYPEWYRRGTF